MLKYSFLKNTMPYPNIAIIGAGPVGTTLARLLFVKAPSVSVTIFESDASPNYRSQGGTLDLHTDTGLAVLKEAGLMGEFLKHARYDGESLKITYKDLNAYYQVRPSESPGKKGGHLGGQRPEIDRPVLRQLLADSLPGGVIRWGYKLQEVVPAADGSPRGTQLVFSVASRDTQGGSTTAPRHTETLSGFDLVVGADGGWSKTRSSALSDTKPFFSGVVCHELRVPDVAAAAPELHALVGGGSVFAHADGLRVGLQQLGDGDLTVGVFYRAEDEGWVRDAARCGFDAADLAATQAALLGPEGRLRGWHPLVREAVARAEGVTTARSLFMLPPGFDWAHRRGVTLAGDAAHVMTPFAGEGVNVGMEDARRLAAAVAAAGEEPERLDAGVAAYEAELSSRAGAFARLTDELLRLWFFTNDSPRRVLPKMMSTHARFHAPPLVKPVAGWLGYGYGSYKALFMG